LAVTSGVWGPITLGFNDVAPAKLFL
jgi:hypothetical protein